jgi:hypothetical protein
MAAIALVSSSSPVDWWDGGHGSAEKGTEIEIKETIKGAANLAPISWCSH